MGNWFVKNTNGYKGINPSAYWDTHLSFVYNQIDPSFIIILSKISTAFKL
jgi:hypothetical protein